MGFDNLVAADLLYTSQYSLRTVMARISQNTEAGIYARWVRSISKLEAWIWLHRFRLVLAFAVLFMLPMSFALFPLFGSAESSSELFAVIGLFVASLALIVSLGVAGAAALSAAVNYRFKWLLAIAIFFPLAFCYWWKFQTINHNKGG